MTDNNNSIAIKSKDAEALMASG